MLDYLLVLSIAASDLSVPRVLALVLDLHEVFQDCLRVHVRSGPLNQDTSRRGVN